ncbi:hypothetical protein SUGI_0093880 [Cryptomeria japonica]|nr:hypothetical protein SUGI_0093880 [Cryptomeria japonica]
MMQLTRRLLDPKRALITFRLLNIEKHLPFIYQFARKMVVNQTEWSDKIETELSSLNIKLSNYIVLSVLRNLKQTPETALNFFNWASTKTEFSHTSSTYNAVIRILGQKSCIDQFWSIVAEMANEGHEIRNKTYREILGRFLDSNMVEDAVALFVLMMGSDKNKPSNLDCRIILHHLSSSGSPDIDLVYRVLETFENGNGKFNKETYDAVHRCLTMADRFDEAVGVMKTMEEAGFLPDNSTFSQLVFGLCKAGTLDEACRVLDAMKELGCTPNLKTWNILIDGHCKAGQIDQLLSYFELMVESGGSADGEVLDTLVKTLCSQNRIEDAHSFLCKMISNKGLKVSRGTFKELLQKLVSAERLQDAIKLSDLMLKQGFPAIVDPFYNLFARCGTVEGAVDFLTKVPS